MLAEEILSQLEIIPLDGLKAHEQTVPENIRALKETMLNLGRLVDPLIIDKENHIVLDGNHRRSVLEILGADNAVCQMVDYEDKSIGVGGWYLASKIFAKSEIKGEKVDKEAGLNALQKMDAVFMHMKKNGGKEECTLVPAHAKELHHIMNEQMEFAKTQPWGKLLIEEKINGTILFIEDDRVDFFLEKGYEVLARKIFTKKEIIAEAVAGRPLPPKSTRHQIPDRIIRLNFRLGYLNESVENATIHLNDMVKKRVKYGSARHYTEPVIVLY